MELERIPECPSCHQGFDMTAVPVGEEGVYFGQTADPQPGDLTVCWGCGTWLAFTEDGTLCKVEQEEIAALDADTRALVRQVARARLENMDKKRVGPVQ